MTASAINPEKVVVIGQGYVGLPLTMRATEVRRYSVVGFDVDASKVQSLLNGTSYIEDVPDSRIRDALLEGYHPTSDPDDLRDFDIAVITVPTPLREGVPDLSYIECAAATLGRYLRPGATVILESTTYPGTTEQVLTPLLSQVSGLQPEEFYVGYSPERIDPGNRSWTFESTPKIVSGRTFRCLTKVISFYNLLCDTVVPVATPAEAEMAKILENTFRYVNVALANEMAQVAHSLGVDIWNVIDAAATKPYGFMKFTPGPGAGGHCLPVDPSYMSWVVERQLGRPFRFINMANDINAHMPDYVVQRLAWLLNDQHKCLNDASILLLGLAYKAGTSDTRETPVTRVIDLLRERGVNVSVSDPLVKSWKHPDPAVHFIEHDLLLHLEQADAVVLLTDHLEFDYRAITAHASLILDTRHKFAPAPNVKYL